MRRIDRNDRARDLWESAKRIVSRGKHWGATSERWEPTDACAWRTIAAMPTPEPDGIDAAWVRRGAARQLMGECHECGTRSPDLVVVRFGADPPDEEGWCTSADVCLSCLDKAKTIAT